MKKILEKIENHKFNIMLLVVLLALIGIYFLLQQPHNNPDSKIIKLVHPEQINKIEISDSNGLSNVLIKRDNNWFVKNSGEELEANLEMINDLIAVLSEEMKLEKVSDNANRYSVYELDDDNIVYLKLYKDDKIIKELGVGKMGSIYPSSFVKLENDPTVYQVDNFLTFIIRNSDWIKSEKVENQENQIGNNN